ncbi:hypothetical protein TcasGA2_TC031173 [Tribolium castaneum]|uniref:Uncharacterized protein n=1 Tax=Tribolium castaneum TaxID=7070 RepID=A0A139WA01_TRICA|nr:hypothetical protein TcasGA2_TC031173 [Tribolium castaneum]
MAITKQMSGQVSRGSAGDYQTDERAGVAGLSWRLPSRGAGRMAIIKQMSGQGSPGSAGDYQAEEQAGFARLSWRLSSRGAGRVRPAQLAIIKQMIGCHVAHFAIIKQMIGRLSQGSDGDYQADEREAVASLSWRLSSR